MPRHHYELCIAVPEPAYPQPILAPPLQSPCLNDSSAALCGSSHIVPGREVAKGVKMRRVRTVIVAPNIEQIETEGGLDDLLASILMQAEAAGIPVVFALSRKKLGQVQTDARLA